MSCKKGCAKKNTDNSVFQGNGLVIVGDNNTIQGNNNSVKGDNNTVQGNNNTVKGDNNTVQGNNNSVKGDNNNVTGVNNSVQGDNNVMNLGSTSSFGATTTTMSSLSGFLSSLPGIYFNHAAPKLPSPHAPKPSAPVKKDIELPVQVKHEVPPVQVKAAPVSNKIALQDKLKDIKIAVAEKEANACAICLTHQNNVLGLPCRHMLGCSQCLATLIAKSVDKNTLKCPICTQVTIDVIHVFF
jgi:hypothetical protein